VPPDDAAAKKDSEAKKPAKEAKKNPDKPSGQ